MIVVVGLLLTTGGHDGLSERPTETDLLRLPEAREGSTPQSQERGDGILLFLVQQAGTPQVEGEGKAGVDARLIPPDAPLAVHAAVPFLPSPASLPYVKQEPNSIEGIICAYPWPQGCEYWIEVARCESTLGTDPWAYDIRNPYTGLFQIWEGHGYGYEWLKDNENNTLAAWELSNEGKKTSPWPACQWQ